MEQHEDYHMNGNENSSKNSKISLKFTPKNCQSQFIELHGHLKQATSANDSGLDKRTVGTVLFDNNKNGVLLVIGHHILEGKESKIEKPLLLLRKNNFSGDAETKKEYLVDTVYNKKIVFRSRPRPIVMNVKKTT